MRLANKIAIVTGGASGFGAGIVRHFAREGARVIIADLNQACADALAGQLGDGVASQPTDVADRASVAALVEAVQTHHGRLDILVNNAGFGHTPQPLEDVDAETFDKVFAVNSRSIYHTAQYAVPLMKRQGGGVILNMASTAGVSPRPHLTWYNASKGWVITATRSMAVELASAQIRVNALSPVAGETPMLQTFMGEDTPEIRAKFLSTIPLGRFSTPDDLGAAAVYLCSDEASMVTGVCMEVDGGRCI